MKPLQIKITSQEEAVKILSNRCHNFDALVSMGTYEDDPRFLFDYKPRVVVHLVVNDLTPWEKHAIGNLASASDILALVDLAEELKNNARVLIHCGAGCCRSPAAAMVLLVAAGWPDHVAVEKVRKLKGGGGIPNGWLLKLADALFDTQLFKYCAESGNTKWTPPWLRGVSWCDPPERKCKQ